ncbi:MAG: DCC1-like thiol-disulfide oxidoreductase family protein [Kiritimatiellia bacterium]
MSPEPIILFDGPCTFCQKSVRFILRHEKSPQLRFASLQSETGKTLRETYRIPPDNDSMILIRNAEAFTGSDAAIRVCAHLRAPWSWLHAFRHLPAFLHAPVYRWIARNRYRWFGKDETCPLPDPDQAHRFLE